MWHYFHLPPAAAGKCLVSLLWSRQKDGSQVCPPPLCIRLSGSGRHLHWASEGALLSSTLCKMILTVGSGFSTTSVCDKFMTAGLNACWASGFPPHSPGCWNIYEENNLVSWKKEIMSYKTVDCHKDSSSSGGLEFLPIICRDKLSGMEITSVQYFTCLMKWK